MIDDLRKRIQSKIDECTKDIDIIHESEDLDEETKSHGINLMYKEVDVYNSVLDMLRNEDGLYEADDGKMFNDIMKMHVHNSKLELMKYFSRMDSEESFNITPQGLVMWLMAHNRPIRSFFKDLERYYELD